MGHAFRDAGDLVLLAGTGDPRLDGSEFLGRAEGHPSAPDAALEVALCRFLADAADARLLAGAHDVAAGGIAVALAESAIAGGIGADVEVAAADARTSRCSARAADAWWSPAAPRDRDALLALAGDLPLTTIGTVGGDTLRVTVAGELARLPVADAARAYERAIPEALA